MIDKIFGLDNNKVQKIFRIAKVLPQGIRNSFIDYLCAYSHKKVQCLETPVRLIWYVDSFCNASCGHCFYGKYITQRETFSQHQFESIVKSFKVRLKAVTLTGGEPFLCRDLELFCRILYEINQTQLIILPTNGSVPEHIEHTLHQILTKTKLKVNVQVSIDGMQAVHDEMRGMQGLFDKTIETLKILKKLKEYYKRINNISVITTMTSKNESSLKDLVSFVRNEIGVHHKLQFVRGAHTDVFNIDQSILSDLDPKYPEKPYDINGINQYLKQEIYNQKDVLLSLKDAELLEKISNMLLNKKPAVKCLAGKLDGVIFQNGDVSHCESTKSFANLKDFNYDFYQLWNSSEANQMRRKITNCFCTHPCNLMTSMSHDPQTLKNLLK